MMLPDFKRAMDTLYGQWMVPAEKQMSDDDEQIVFRGVKHIPDDALPWIVDWIIDNAGRYFPRNPRKWFQDGYAAYEEQAVRSAPGSTPGADCPDECTDGYFWAWSVDYPKSEATLRPCRHCFPWNETATTRIKLREAGLRVLWPRENVEQVKYELGLRQAPPDGLPDEFWRLRPHEKPAYIMGKLQENMRIMDSCPF
jgi:hypothetical protein